MTSEPLPGAVSVARHTLDLSAARLALLRKRRKVVRKHVLFATAVILIGTFAGATGLLSPGAPVGFRLSVAILGFGLFDGILGGMFLWAANRNRWLVPLSLEVDPGGFSFTFPKGLVERYSWRGGWIRIRVDPPTGASSDGTFDRGIQMEPPYIGRGDARPPAGLTAEAMQAVLQAGIASGLHVKTEVIQKWWPSGCPPGTTFYHLHR